MSAIPLGVLISGTGSNFGAIVDAIEGGRLPAEVRVCLSNRSDAKGLARAADAGIASAVVDHKQFSSREDFDTAVVTKLRDAGVEWVVLAGFMRIVTPVLLSAFPNRVINIHPSLLPAFPGVDAQRQAFDYGVRVTGCTVHLVDDGMDTGPIIAQRPVSVMHGESLESLRARILAEEHALLVECLAMIASGALKVVPQEGKRAKVVVRG